MLTTKRKAQLIIITTFLTGLVAGTSGRYLLSRRSLIEQAGPAREMLNEISRVIKLDANQRLMVKQVLKDTNRQYEDLRIQFRPQHEAFRDTCRQRIRVLLSREQQILYDQWIREQDLKRKAREEAARNAR